MFPTYCLLMNCFPYKTNGTSQAMDIDLLRPQFVLKLHYLDNAQVVDYKALILPSESIEPLLLRSIKQFVKDFLQRQVDEALSLFMRADDHHKETAFYKANQAREATLKSMEGC